MADFAVDFRVKAAATNWNPAALKSVYFHALNESFKDELATLDEPEYLEDFINLTIGSVPELGRGPQRTG